MAHGPEEKVKRWLLYKLKKDYPNCWTYRAPGGRYGRAGVPDILCCIDGIFVAIEVKADKKKHPTAIQMYELRQISKAKGISVVLRDKDDVKYNQMKAIIDKRREKLAKEEISI